MLNCLSGDGGESNSLKFCIAQYSNGKRKIVHGLKNNFGIGNQFGTCFHPIHTSWKKCKSYLGAMIVSQIMYVYITLVE
jgi:hypothetical protein